MPFCLFCRPFMKHPSMIIFTNIGSRCVRLTKEKKFTGRLSLTCKDTNHTRYKASWHAVVIYMLKKAVNNHWRTVSFVWLSSLTGQYNLIPLCSVLLDPLALSAAVSTSMQITFHLERTNWLSPLLAGFRENVFLFSFCSFYKQLNLCPRSWGL